MLAFLFCDRNLSKIVLKNMSGHQHRNAKTAIMFTTALAFMIFTGASFSLIGDMLVSGLKQFAGADFSINAAFEED